VEFIAEQVNRLPSDIFLNLIKVFQKSSADEFSNMFAYLEIGRDIDQMLIRGNRHLVPSRTYSYCDIILLVVNKRQLICTNGTWNGVATTGTDSALVQNQTWARSTPVCWNCGGSHKLADYNKERNSARIEEGKQHFIAAREEHRARSAENEGGPVENNASKKMVRDGQHCFSSCAVENGCSIRAILRLLSPQPYQALCKVPRPLLCHLNQVHQCHLHLPGPSLLLTLTLVHFYLEK
jgi:hypothetical protein